VELPTLTELKVMPLPKNLFGFIAMLGMERPSFIAHQEWNQLGVLYKTMRELRDDDGFEALASRLISHLNFYRKLQESDPRHALSSKLAKKLRRKDRNRSKRTGATPYQRSYEPSTEEKARKRLAVPKIGLGIESTLPPTQKVRRDQVKIDAYTQAAESPQSNHVLYVAGWTLADDTD
jgi:hypothetical protein